MKLAVVAASGLAMEALAVVHGLRTYSRIRILDDDRARWGAVLAGDPVVGPIDQIGDYADHRVLVCAGRGSSRLRIVERLTALGVDESRYVTLIHPSVVVPDGCTVGAGSVLLAGTVLTANVRIGRHVVVMPNATLTHDDELADFATVCAGVSLGGRVRVGRAAYVGMNAAVREGLSIGHDATLGMGAALVRDLPPGETWVGTPARPIRRGTLEMAV